MRTHARRGAAPIWDDVLMIALALASLALLWLQLSYPLSSEQTQLIDWASTAIAFVFLLEFCIRLYVAQSHARFIRWNWWMLLASIPVMSGATQALRGLQLLRLFRLADFLQLLQVVRGTNEIEKFEHKKGSGQHA